MEKDAVKFPAQFAIDNRNSQDYVAITVDISYPAGGNIRKEHWLIYVPAERKVTIVADLDAESLARDTAEKDELLRLVGEKASLFLCQDPEPHWKDQKEFHWHFTEAEIRALAKYAEEDTAGDAALVESENE